MRVHAFDEMSGTVSGGAAAPIRAAYARLKRWLDEAPSDLIDARRSQAELFFRRIGITFAVYGDNEATERLIPFDIIPRVLTKPEWAIIERGLAQRVTALNAFLSDIYGAQECIKAGVIPADLVYRNPHYRLEMMRLRVRRTHVYVHIAGIDVVRVDEDTFYVLEDNVRTPSGVSYMLENREVMMRLFPELFTQPPRRAGRELSGRAARHLALGRAGAAKPGSDRGAADPRPVQFGVLRALVPGRQARRRTGRGLRPLRQGRCRLHAHDRRPDARRRDLPAHRRRLPRPARLPARIPCSACRA